MIPYEELCQALDRYNAQQRNAAELEALEQAPESEASPSEAYPLESADSPEAYSPEPADGHEAAPEHYAEDAGLGDTSDDVLGEEDPVVEPADDSEYPT